MFNKFINFWNKIDPYHVCPLYNDNDDEYLFVAGKCVELKGSNVKADIAFREILSMLFSDDEIAAHFINLKEVSSLFLEQYESIK